LYRGLLEQRIDDDASLARAAATELDEIGCAHERAEAPRTIGEDQLLGARQVIFGQRRDAVEEPRAMRVVEIFGRQCLGTRAESANDVVTVGIARADLETAYADAGRRRKGMGPLHAVHVAPLFPTRVAEAPTPADVSVIGRESPAPGGTPRRFV